MSIMANDIKKGATVRLKDGTMAKVMDNLKGIIRTIKVPMIGRPGEFDTSSGYIDEWWLLEGDRGDPVDIKMSEQQTARMKKIRIQGW